MTPRYLLLGATRITVGFSIVCNTSDGGGHCFDWQLSPTVWEWDPAGENRVYKLQREERARHEKDLKLLFLFIFIICQIHHIMAPRASSHRSCMIVSCPVWLTYCQMILVCGLGEGNSLKHLPPVILPFGLDLMWRALGSNLIILNRRAPPYQIVVLVAEVNNGSENWLLE